MRFGIFMPKMNPNGRRFESPSGKKLFSDKIHQKRKIDVKCRKSTVTVIKR
jgi:hypothetical protein